MQSKDNSPFGPRIDEITPLTLGGNLDVSGGSASAFVDKNNKPLFPIYGSIARFFNHKIVGTLDPYAPPEFPDADGDRACPTLSR